MIRRIQVVHLYSLDLVYIWQTLLNFVYGVLILHIFVSKTEESPIRELLCNSENFEYPQISSSCENDIKIPCNVYKYRAKASCFFGRRVSCAFSKAGK